MNLSIMRRKKHIIKYCTRFPNCLFLCPFLFQPISPPPTAFFSLTPPLPLICTQIEA